MSTKIRGLGLLLPLTLAVSTCGGPLAPPEDEAKPIPERPRVLTALEQAVVTGANTFGFSLIGKVAADDPRPNIVLSPLSASFTLGMTMNGAAGGTFDAMRATLGFSGLSQQEINDTYHRLIGLFTTLDPDVTFDVADAVWADDGFVFHDAFLHAVQDAFAARIESSDFSDPATVAAINAWVSDHTDGRIDRIVDQLDPSLVMLLLNTIYFDGPWKTRFDPDETRPADFTREDGSKVTVDMMNLGVVALPMGGGPGYQAVELPYAGGAFTMVILVPSGDTTARDLLRGLDPAAWSQIVGNLTLQEVDQLSLPKFTLSYDTFLNDALKAMGMGVAFGPDADFTAMSPRGDELCIDFVRQKTFIEVDERGTRAAAVTAGGIGAVSFNGLIVDRPFAFVIREHFSDTILFMGMIGDPTHEDSGSSSLTSTCG